MFEKSILFLNLDSSPYASIYSSKSATPNLLNSDGLNFVMSIFSVVFSISAHAKGGKLKLTLN